MSYTPNTAPGLKPLTLTYKVVQDVPICLDVYPPLFAIEQIPLASTIVTNLNASHIPVSIPAVVYFHGGGLTVGNRQSWFPRWMQGMLWYTAWSSILQLTMIPRQNVSQPRDTRLSLPIID